MCSAVQPNSVAASTVLNCFPLGFIQRLYVCFIYLKVFVYQPETWGDVELRAKVEVMNFLYWSIYYLSLIIVIQHS